MAPTRQPPRPDGGRGRAAPRRRRGLLYWLAVAALWAVLVSGAAIAFYAWDLPSMDRVTVIEKRPAIRLVAADGSTFATLGDLYGDPLALADYPPVLVQAVLAIEDRRFYEHSGFDPIGILRALAADLATGRLAQGGSTISQQTAKTVFLTTERSVRRKIQEAILTIELESRYSKDEILSLYLNRVYLGAGAYGMDAAARRYFGHSARALTLPEAAMLAGLMKAPSRYSPLADYAAAKARSDVVLDAMADAGALTAAQAAAAKAAPPPLAARPVGNDARYFADWVVDQIPDYAGQAAGDLTIYTTLDPAIERAAEAALDQVLDDQGAKSGAGQGALVAMAPDGAVLALLGGRDYDASQFNRATKAMRQPGSAFKLFVYLAALEAGFTPDSVVEDAPIDIGGYRPENLEPGYAGPVSLRTAFARSINTVAVRLLVKVGAGRVADMARRLGLTSDIPANASIALGSAEVTPLELTGAYAAVGNGGSPVYPYAISRIEDADGSIVYQRAGGGGGQTLAPGVVAQMDDLLAAVIAQGTGRAAALGRPAGGKTGTSQDYRNAWFLGFSSGITTGVWVGNDDGSPMNKVTGGTLPARIWKTFMADAVKGRPAAVLTAPIAGKIPQSRAPEPEHDLLDDIFSVFGGGSSGSKPSRASPPGVVYEYPDSGGRGGGR